MDIAEWIYTVGRLESIAVNRRIIPEKWEERDKEFRKQFTDYIESLQGKPLPTPEEAHNSWWRRYKEMGWKYGEVRDPVVKTHPDMVPFNELPKDEQEKDEAFLALVEFAFKYILPSQERNKSKEVV
ncbi:MAG: RyR domain-containing protein [Caldisphaera sp.]